MNDLEGKYFSLIFSNFLDDQNDYLSYVARNNHVISSSCDDEERKGRIDPSVKKTYHNGIFELLGNFDNGGGDNFHYMPEEHLVVGKSSNGCLGNNITLPNQQSGVIKH